MKDFGFRKAKHLVKTDEISSVFSLNRRFSSEHFQVLVMPQARAFGRMAVIVGKKTAALASARNYMKRVARESFRHRQGDLDGLDIVVRVRKSFIRTEYTAVCAELMQGFERARREFPRPSKAG